RTLGNVTSRAMGLDRENLTPAASLNRLVLTDLPGLSLDPGCAGKSGFELLAAKELGALVLAHADELQLTNQERAHAADLPNVISNRLSSPDEKMQAAAERIARTFGRRIGFLIATLKRGEAVSRALREEWDDSYWDFWSSVETICLGGGLMEAPLG